MVKIWDNQNKQWLDPIDIRFDRNNLIASVSAIKPGDDPLKDGWYKIEGDDLNKIAIQGMINMNLHNLPQDEKSN